MKRFLFQILFGMLFFGASAAKPINLIKDLDLNSYELKYKGTIDGTRYISMFLNEKGDKLTGIYFYDNNKYYLTLEGTINKTNHTIIHERNYKGIITGTFEGVLLNEDFKGIWKNDLKELKFEMINQAPLKTGDNGPATIADKSRSVLPFILIIVILMLGLAVFLYRKKNTQITANDQSKVQDGPVSAPIDIDKLSSKIVNDLKQANVSIPAQEAVENEIEKNKVTNEIDLSSFEKGKVFENFVINKFNANYFTQTHRTPDSRVNGIAALSNRDPDFVYQFKHKTNVKQFAVECKFKSKKTNNVLIDEESKLNHYRKYAKENGLEVYIVLGLGGTPHNPSELFIIPLSEIKQSEIDYDTLKKYCRSNVNNFFYNTEIHRLT